MFRFLYWNMNYHVEHHMFPMVPYHALPALHAEMKADCPPPTTSVWAAYREIVPTLLRQREGADLLRAPRAAAGAWPQPRRRRRRPAA